MAQFLGVDTEVKSIDQERSINCHNLSLIVGNFPFDWCDR
jgi:hypothetical protein